MPNIHWQRYDLHFARPSGTSRGVLRAKPSWFLFESLAEGGVGAVGECSIIEGLSPDDVTQIEPMLQAMTLALSENEPLPDLRAFPALRFALEQFRLDRMARATKRLFESAFTSGQDRIHTNGLIWMGTREYVQEQVRQKIDLGFTCIKMKVGATNFEEELEVLRWIRREFGRDVELRLDANGAFDADDALSKLERLSSFQIHSIEQPIAPGQWKAMEHLCRHSPIDVALDEELIGARTSLDKHRLLQAIRPAYIILKPSLLGGFQETDHWIALAEHYGIGWWITSALESNVGLNAIAQYTYVKNVVMPQGLGTGMLYTNNFESPLYLNGPFLCLNPTTIWNLNPLNQPVGATING